MAARAHVWGRLRSLNPDVWEDIVLDEIEVDLGRSANCHPLSRYTDPAISTRHCILYKEKGVAYVEDTSTNGTFLNEQLVGKGNRCQLKSNDLLSLVVTGEHDPDFRRDSVAYVFVAEKPPAARAAPKSSKAQAYQTIVVKKNRASEMQTKTRAAGDRDYTDFFVAAHDGNTSVMARAIRALKQRALSVNKTDDGHWTALHWCAANGYAEMTDQLLDAGADHSKADDDGMTPLHLAAYNGHASVVQVLLEDDAEIDAVDKDGMMPIHHCCLNGSRQCLSLLLSAGSDPAAEDYEGTTAADLANDECQRVLLAHKRARDREKRASLKQAAVPRVSGVKSQRASASYADAPSDLRASSSSSSSSLRSSASGGSSSSSLSASSSSSLSSSSSSSSKDRANRRLSTSYSEQPTSVRDKPTSLGTRELDSETKQRVAVITSGGSSKSSSKKDKKEKYSEKDKERSRKDKKSKPELQKKLSSDADFLKWEDAGEPSTIRLKDKKAAARPGLKDMMALAEQDAKEKKKKKK